MQVKKSVNGFCLALCGLILTFGFENTMANTAETLLVFDNENYTELPKNWREPIGLVKKETPFAFLEGLNKLQASASGQFSETTLNTAFPKHDRAKVWIIDLRGEAHGFLDGQAVSWYGYRNLALQNLSLQELLQEETRLLESLKKQDTITVYQIEKKVGGEIQQVQERMVKPQRVESEAQLTKRLGFHYKRFVVLDRHPPS
ncbi:MAG TPA: hypothetical protein VFP93_01425, partial [Gammaproteobacteria bacterium]|nr:hypothetical protein [Gammaproteobacteria bacterium]